MLGAAWTGSRTAATAALAACSSIATLACSTASVLPPQEVPVVESIGDGVVRFGGQDAWVAVDYRFARQSPGEPWLLLDVGATAADGRRATIERSKVFVRSP